MFHICAPLYDSNSTKDAKTKTAYAILNQTSKFDHESLVCQENEAELYHRAIKSATPVIILKDASWSNMIFSPDSFKALQLDRESDTT